MTDPENPQKPKSAASPAPSEDMWADAEGAENVVQLTAGDFDEFISTHSSVLVMFYAPCKCFLPEVSLTYITLSLVVLMRFVFLIARVWPL